MRFNIMKCLVLCLLLSGCAPRTTNVTGMLVKVSTVGNRCGATFLTVQTGVSGLVEVHMPGDAGAFLQSWIGRDIVLSLVITPGFLCGKVTKLVVNGISAE